MKKYAVPIILGTITTTEIVVLKDIDGSIFLWVMYGIYKIFKLSEV